MWVPYVHRPSWPGGVAVPIRKNCEATTAGTDGVVVQTRTIHLSHHPVRSLPMLRDYFLMSRPPLLARRGNGTHSDSFTNASMFLLQRSGRRMPLQWNSL